MKNLIKLSIAFSFIFILGCKSEEEKKQELVFSINETFCQDIRSIIKKSINEMTFGIGGSVYESLVTKSQEKEMFCDQIVPVLKKDLNDLTLQELEKIQLSTTEKNKFILRTIVSHKDDLLKQYEKYQPEVKKYADILFEFATKKTSQNL